FPVDVAIAEFNPDVIIGVNVSTRKYDDYPFESDDRLISNELFLMLIDKADPAKIPDGGFYIEPNLSAYTGFDFSKVNQLIDSGYVATIVQIEEIKSSIKRRVSCEEITNARNDFNVRKKPLQFGNIRYEGFNKRQRAYINNLFAIDEKPLSLHEVKTGYFKLVAEDYFKSIYPTVNYNKDSESYDLTLSQRPGNNTKIDFGGNLSTRNISNMFLGLNYYHFSNFLFHANAEFYAGNFYKSVQVKTQFDLPYLGRFYIEPEAVVNVWDFLESDDLILFDRLPTALERIDRRLGVNIGHAVKDKYKLTYAVHGIYNTDRFINSTVLSSLDVYDRLNLSGLRTQINFSKYDLNRKQYASKGRNFNLNLSYFDVNENLVPGTTSVFDNEITNNHKWFRARLNYEQYFKSRTFYTPGILVEALVSNQPAFSSYKASLISAPGFYPLQDSRTIFLENFRAYNYVAMGTRNVFNIRKSLDFRFEAYVFRPIEAIREGQNQRPVLFSSEKDFHFAASGNLVFHSAIGPISLSA
ncbi:MAG TPA: hypothetical protein PKC24_15775, partial [Cyclobacteriaceae bacterium]|nr:hypothetical protein [Cyclobacteriaceae bacterium]